MMSGEATRWLWSSLHADAISAARHAPSGGSANVWTVAAVVVAVAGSAIVAWQAWETHRTTDLGRAALAASHSLAIDGARSRLDQGAPGSMCTSRVCRSSRLVSWTCPALRSSPARDGT